MSEDTSPSQGQKQYKILKIPINREKSVFYYYKAFDTLDVPSEKQERLIDIPKSKSIYLCHFARDIEEDFILKFFGELGKIK